MELNVGPTAIPSASGGSVCGRAVTASSAQSCSMTSVECVEETTPVAQRLLEPSIKKGNVMEQWPMCELKEASDSPVDKGLVLRRQLLPDSLTLLSLSPLPRLAFIQHWQCTRHHSRCFICMIHLIFTGAL